MERMLLFAFLDVKSSGCEFREQLPLLQKQSILRSAKEVQCYDSDGELQTDGNRSGHLQNGELGEFSFPCAFWALFLLPSLFTIL